MPDPMRHRRHRIAIQYIVGELIVDTAPAKMNGLLDSLGTITEERLGTLSPGQVAKVVRRIVDHEAVAPKLDVAAFNSAI